MPQPVIRVENLGKRYDLRPAQSARYATVREALAQGVRQLFGTRPPAHRDAESTDEFWALRNVSFTVGEGEVVGVIGRNGAGKSTLLKVLSGITEPTTGRVTIRGRVASLLEVGTGFHPELTGRENIFLNGAILGMTRLEIREKFPQIVAFAEIDRFLDVPVKRYSSGMYVRLAFAVAAHLEPEILVVDEVLAVGDAEFQKKCLGKMGAVAKSGRTVLFVSHNMAALQSLCERAILLCDGQVVLDAPAGKAIEHYLVTGRGLANSIDWTNEADRPGSDALRLTHVSALPADASAVALTMDSGIKFRFGVERLAANRTMHITFHLINEQGIVVLTSGTPPLPPNCGPHRANCVLPGGLLNSGLYAVKILVVEDGNRVTYANDDVVSFEVHDTRERGPGWMGREPGVVQPSLEWTLDATD